MQDVQFYTFAERPCDDALTKAIERVVSASWPRFLRDLKEEISGDYFGQLEATFPKYMTYVLAEDKRILIAVGASIPVYLFCVE